MPRSSSSTRSREAKEGPADEPPGTRAGWWQRAPRPVKVVSGTLVLLLALYGGAILVLRPPSPGMQISLDTLVREATQGSVKTARFLDEDARVIGAIAMEEGQPPTDYWTSYPRSDAATNDLLKTLLASGTNVTVDPQTKKSMIRFVAQFLLPLVILANLFALLFVLSKQGGGGGGGIGEYLLFGRVGDKQLTPKERPKTTFEDLAGAEETVAELAELCAYLSEPAAFKKMGALPPKGVLLVGPPGCGKTLLARAVAGQADAAFYSISGSEFVESLVGVGAARVRDLFRQALASAPSIIFIDELDGAGRQRGAGLGGGHDEREQTLNELLVQMDGFSPADGLVVIGATNRPDILDPALLRAGRFDRRVTVERPALDQRLAILQLHAKGRRLEDPENDLPYVAKRTPGFTGADLANVINEAALLAVRWRASAISRRHLEEAVERLVSGPRRASRIIPPDEKRHIAFHEAGHAVVAAAMDKADKLDKLSLVARGGGVGHLTMLSEDKDIVTRSDMEAEITIAMAGIAAEEMALGEPSTGSESDLQRATETARDMAGRFGMSPRLGRVRVLQEHGTAFLGRDYMLNAEVSQPTLEHLDGEVRRILDEREQVAREILSSHRSVLDSLAFALMQDETLHGPTLEAALQHVGRYEPTADGADGASKAAPTRKPRSAAPRQR